MLSSRGKRGGKRSAAAWWPGELDYGGEIFNFFSFFNYGGVREKTMLLVLGVLVLCLSILLDITFNLHFCSKAVSIYIIVMELLSIVENLTKAGVEMGKLSDILKIKNEGDEKNETK